MNSEALKGPVEMLRMHATYSILLERFGDLCGRHKSVLTSSTHQHIYSYPDSPHFTYLPKT